MIKQLFPDFANNAIIWIYSFDSDLDKKDILIVEQALARFIKSWKSHGTPVRGDYAILFNRFVFLCADATVNVSGCSIDSSVRVFKELYQKHNLNALDINIVFYKDKNNILSVNRFEFQKLINQGKINQDTIVYNTSIHSLGELRAGFFESKLKDCWHSKVFALSA
jgi:hypothetical protein